MPRPRAVVFDIDGCLADSSHRRTVVTDWPNATVEDVERWASLQHLDVPIDPVVELARTLYTSGYAVVLLTSRDIASRQRTMDWMKAYGVPFDALYMRESLTDRRVGPVYKAEQLDLYIRGRYCVELALDDEEGVVDMYRQRGIICLRVPHSVPPYGQSATSDGRPQVAA